MEFILVKGENRIIKNQKLEISIIINNYLNESALLKISSEKNNDAILNISNFKLTNLNDCIFLNKLDEGLKYIYCIISKHNNLSQIKNIKIKINDGENCYSYLSKDHINTNSLNLIEIYFYKNDWKFRLLVNPGYDSKYILNKFHLEFVENELFNWRNQYKLDLNYKGS